MCIHISIQFPCVICLVVAGAGYYRTLDESHKARVGDGIAEQTANTVLSSTVSLYVYFDIFKSRRTEQTFISHSGIVSSPES